MIDLHLHSTASDGRAAPAELAARAAAAGLAVISVTDHDTVAAVDEVAAAGRGLRVVPGIEITAVADGRDVHVLGYFIDHHSAALAAFLDDQRRLRVERARAIAERLVALGVPVDLDALLAPATRHPAWSVGRPLIARALVQAGHAASVQEAFERWLGAGRPAFVPRVGRSPAAVVEAIHAAGGVASFAHPALTARDDLIEPLAADGLDAIEVYHAEHGEEETARYLALATRLGLAVSGGSDYHGDIDAAGSRRSLGRVRLPPEHFAALEARVVRAPRAGAE